MHINSANGGQYSFSGTETNPKAKFILFLKGIRQSLRDYSDEFIPLMKIPNLDSPTEHPLTQGYDPRMNKLLYTVLWHLLRVPARLVLDDEDIEETADGRMAMLRLYSMYCEAGETELADVTSQMTDLHFTLEPKDEPQTTIREIERLHREYCTLSCQPWTDGAAITATLMTLNTGYTWLRRDVDRGVIPNLHELQREIVKHHQAHKSANDAATRRQMATTRHSVALAAAEARIQSLESDVAAAASLDSSNTTPKRFLPPARDGSGGRDGGGGRGGRGGREGGRGGRGAARGETSWRTSTEKKAYTPKWLCFLCNEPHAVRDCPLREQCVKLAKSNTLKGLLTTGVAAAAVEDDKNDNSAQLCHEDLCHNLDDNDICCAGSLTHDAQLANEAAYFITADEYLHGLSMLAEDSSSETAETWWTHNWGDNDEVVAGEHYTLTQPQPVYNEPSSTTHNM
jgi:hypothetical protein